jgi:hypothetical protein
MVAAFFFVVMRLIFKLFPFLLLRVNLNQASALVPIGMGDVMENMHFAFWQRDSAGLRVCTSAIAKTVRKIEGKV